MSNQPLFTKSAAVKAANTYAAAAIKRILKYFKAKGATIPDEDLKGIFDGLLLDLGEPETQQAPVIVNVPAPVVHVQVPPQPAPQVIVNPELRMPPTKTKLKVYRDRQTGRMTSAESETTSQE